MPDRASGSGQGSNGRWTGERLCGKRSAGTKLDFCSFPPTYAAGARAFSSVSRNRLGSFEDGRWEQLTDRRTWRQFIIERKDRDWLHALAEMEDEVFHPR